MKVLIATLGEAPGIITEAIDLLRSEDILIDKVFLIHTADSGIKEAFYYLKSHINTFPDYNGKISVDVIPISDYEDVMSSKAIEELIKSTKKVFEFHKTDDIYVCISGGRKSMSTILALFSQIYSAKKVFHIVAPEDIEKKWIDIRHMDENGKNRFFHPSVSKLRSVSLPIESITSLWLQEKKADVLFNRCNYASAGEIYKDLKEYLSEPREIEIKQLIAEGYHNWDNFRFEDVTPKIEEVLNKIERFKKLLDKKDALEKHLNILKVISNGKDYVESIKSFDYFKNISLFFYSKAERYAENEIYDLGILSLYRITELISQHRLAVKGIDTENVSNEVRGKYNNSFKGLKKEILDAEAEIPDKIGLFDSWLLLSVMKDELFAGMNEEKLKAELRKLNGKLSIRNRLWIEHRNSIGNMNEFNDLKKFTKGWLEKRIPDLEKEKIAFRFITF